MPGGPKQSRRGSEHPRGSTAVAAEYRFGSSKVSLRSGELTRPWATARAQLPANQALFARSSGDLLDIPNSLLTREIQRSMVIRKASLVARPGVTGGFWPGPLWRLWTKSETDGAPRTVMLGISGSELALMQVPWGRAREPEEDARTGLARWSSVGRRNPRR